MNSKSIMRKAARQTGLTHLLLAMAASDGPMDEPDVERLCRALALLGEHGYSLRGGKKEIHAAAAASGPRFGLVW